ncbi:uncharacterized protein LOC114522920 [Dendronephthya gigantea]|uniref:uncharacterized protein LOC114522920 n=1 Tax=Dendronephthya gigantea TaxID=151771 RepID=UPI001069F091|nr:uncharacterized protein LOC114522920 [Dendronephthya gigantea]
MPMDGKRVSNIYGQVYDFAKEMVTSLDQVYPGDHIAYERVKLYWHHVIVEDVDRELEEVKIIHYYNNVREFFETTSKEGSLAQVMRGSIKFWSKRFYRIVYNVETYPPEKVLELACDRLGEKKYNPLTSNCEHFCTECRIGKAASVQVEYLVENIIATVLPSLSRPLLEFLLRKTVQKSIEEFTKNTAKHLAREILPKLSHAVFRIALLRCIGLVGSRVSWVSLQQSTVVIVRGVVATEAGRLCKTGTKEVVRSLGQSLAVKKIPEGTSSRKAVCRMTKSGVLAGVAIELAFMSKDIRAASVKKNAGEITKEEYEETVIKRVVGASVSAPMSLAGSVVGQYVLPVPVVGNVIGGITGSAAGRVVGAVLSAGVIRTKERVGKLMKSFSWKRV